MATQRVLVLTNGSILMASVLSLLREVDGLDVSSIATADVQVLDKISRLTPDIVVLDGDESAGDRTLIADTLNALPRSRVVTVEVGRTGIGVYRTRRISRASLNGLLLAIRGRTRRQRGAAPGSRASAAETTVVGARHGTAPPGHGVGQEDGDSNRCETTTAACQKGGKHQGINQGETIAIAYQ